MRDRSTPPGSRCWNPDYGEQQASSRLFIPLDAITLAWLKERADGRPLGTVAADLLRELAVGQTEPEAR